MTSEWQCGECRQTVPDKDVVLVPLRRSEDDQTITATAYCCPYCDDVLKIEQVKPEVKA